MQCSAWSRKKDWIDEFEDRQPGSPLMVAHSTILRRFVASREARSLAHEAGWCRTMADFGRKFLGKEITETGGADLEEILFRLFPREVICEPSDAKSIILELRAFFTFLKRAYQAPKADRCLSVLDGGAISKLERLLADPAKFGVAKLFLTETRAIAPFLQPTAAAV